MVSRDTSSTPSVSLRARSATAFSVVLGAYLVGTGMTLVWRLVLPAKYYADSSLLGRLMADEVWHGARALFSSYANTAFAYHLLGFTESTPHWVVGPLVFSLAFVPVALALLAGLRRPSWGRWTVMALWLGALSIYLGQFSKELLTIYAAGIALWAAGAFGRYVGFAFLPVLVYGLFVRPYWLLIAVFWALLWWLLRRRWTATVKVLFLIGTLASVSLAFRLAEGHYLTALRSTLNASRAGAANAQTMIHNLVPATSLVADIANWFASIVSITIPVPALIPPEVQVVPYVVLTATTLWLLVRRVPAVLTTVAERRRVAAATFLLAAVLVMAVFEPDYGSVLKHEVGLLPMVVYLLALGGGRASQQRERRARAP